MAARSTLWLAGMGAVILLLVVASVLIALMDPAGGVTEYPESTPEGVVQRYLRSLEDRDYAAARAYYTSGMQDGCSVEDVRMASEWLSQDPSSRRIELVEKKALTGDTAQVHVRVIEVTVTPPFGVDEYSHDEWYTLSAVEGSWRLSSPGWPVYGCPQVRPPVETSRLQ
jgi:hypothetical protein